MGKTNTHAQNRDMHGDKANQVFPNDAENMEITMRLSEAGLFKFCAGFGPIAMTLGLMSLTGTAADAFIAGFGAISVSWVLLTVADVLVGQPAIVVKWRDIEGEDDGR